MSASLESDLSLPELNAFSILKNGFELNPDLRNDLESIMRTIVERHNPSDRAERFVFGGACEWAMATACWVAGIHVFPAGHSQNGFDLTEYKNGLQGLWSIKSSAVAKPTGEIHLINSIGSTKQKQYIHPTVFLAPYLPGITYFNPELAPGYASKIVYAQDATKIKARDILNFAVSNPEFVIPFSMPVNVGAPTEDPNLKIVFNILTSGTYKELGPAIKKLKAVSDKVGIYRELLAGGQMTEESFKANLKEVESDL
jgi:hypothetical protein